MGRIRYKTFFCAFCIDRNPDNAAQDEQQAAAYNVGVDVSHLATPHVSSNQSLAMATGSNSANSTPVGDTSSINIADDSNPSLNQSLTQKPAAGAHFLPSLEHTHRGTSDCSTSQGSQLFQDNNNNTSSGSRMHLPPATLNSHTPIPGSPAAQNLYELSRQPSPPVPLQEPPGPDLNQPRTSPIAPLRANEREAQHAANNAPGNSSDHHDKTTAKLSYDIISVREPLAKILADRQHAHQLQQRQILGDHEYIEVYGERGSSCFYEEIAGSTTSSATYDQIGTNSNHNYQVLVNSYAAVNRQPLVRDSLRPLAPDSVDHTPRNELDQNQPRHNSSENLYDVTHAPTTHSTNGQTKSPLPSTSKAIQQPLLNHHNDQALACQSPPPTSSGGVSSPTKSMPVYSVINKSTRRSNLPIKKPADDRPPQPPPKNLTPPSAIPKQPHQYPLSSTMNKQISYLSSTSSYTPSGNNLGDRPELSSHIPRPPPRFSKLPRFNAMSRPLPMPDNPCLDSNESPLTIMGLTSQNGDSESINSGYELLTTNFDDEQIDVGYEKIRECNRYSGGSLSSQFNPLNVLDNGGYESVQPIYSSPSNALAEPNYEAIGPATASELAAAATARLTAAATVIEQFLKQD